MDRAMISINDVAPSKKNFSQEQLQEQDEVIDMLLKAFVDNYNAHKESKREDEINYILFSSPGPSQYTAFADFFSYLEDGEDQILPLKDYMYMHDFADMDNDAKPAILVLLQNLIKVYNEASISFKGRPITMVSGSFWAHHIPTRMKLILLFELLKSMEARLRVVTRASRNEEFIDNLASILGRDSLFSIPNRVPMHFLRDSDDFLFFEFPHTESSVIRLNMLLDLNTLRYEKGKTKADLLKFLDAVVMKGL